MLLLLLLPLLLLPVPPELLPQLLLLSVDRDLCLDAMCLAKRSLIEKIWPHREQFKGLLLSPWLEVGLSSEYLSALLLIFGRTPTPPD